MPKAVTHRCFLFFVALSLILVVQSGTSVVSSRVIIPHIVWTRKRLESQVIVTDSHRPHSYQQFGGLPHGTPSEECLMRLTEGHDDS